MNGYRKHSSNVFTAKQISRANKLNNITATNYISKINLFFEIIKNVLLRV